MIQRLLLAVPMGIAWMVLTSNLALDAFLVGYVIGSAILMLVSPNGEKIEFARLPGQLRALAVYTVVLGRDILLSGIDVAKKVIRKDMELRSGIIAVPTQDPTENDTIAALSAHAITITPGELVVDFDGGRALYVHCLDAEASARGADAAQARRLGLLNRIMGRK